MPKIVIDGNTYFLRWTKEENEQILRIAKKYRKYSAPFKRGYRTTTHRVDWKRAEADGALKGLPDIPIKHYSQRLSTLRKRNANPKTFLKEKREYQRKRGRVKSKNSNGRLAVWNKLTAPTKRKHGVDVKQVWREEQKKLLLEIVGDYTDYRIDWKLVHKQCSEIGFLPQYDTPSKLSSVSRNCVLEKDDMVKLMTIVDTCSNKPWINWSAVMADPRISEIPSRYHNDLYHLRRYYWSAIKNEVNIEKKRASAREYVRRTRKKYRENEKKRRGLIREATNEELAKQVKRRTC